MKRLVITHPTLGIYLGSAMGFGFWSLLDSVGQEYAVVFPDKDKAKEHVASWDSESDPDGYQYVEVECASNEYASYLELARAGLEVQALPLLLNAKSAGSA